MEIVRAAGGVVWRRNDGDQVEVAVVHRPKYDDWSLPKGKLHPGESELDAALREVQEETGLRCQPGDELPSSEYHDRYGRPKTVRYWSMSPVGGSFAPTREVDEMRWLTVEAAGVLLSYPRDREVLESLSVDGISGARVVTILLVRHAHAGSSEKWSGPGPDEVRPLSRKGWRQAQALVGLLEEYEISRLLSSPYLRCVQTLEPLADALGLEIERAGALAEGADPKDTRELIRDLADTTAALSTHGDVVPAILELLAAEEGFLELPPDYPYKKGSTWVLGGDHQGVVTARYLPPPPA